MGRKLHHMRNKSFRAFRLLGPAFRARIPGQGCRVLTLPSPAKQTQMLEHTWGALIRQYEWVTVRLFSDRLLVRADLEAEQGSAAPARLGQTGVPGRIRR